MLLSQLSSQEKVEGFQLTRFVGMLAPTVISIY
jgi:hypothetical protein